MRLITIEDGIRREVSLRDILRYTWSDEVYDIVGIKDVAEMLDEKGYELIIGRKSNG